MSIVDVVKKRYEGMQSYTDAFRAAQGTLPIDVSSVKSGLVSWWTEEYHPSLVIVGRI